MRYLSKVLAAGGLVLVTGPLCLLASAQTYVDVEAERAAASSGGSTTAPAAAPGGAAPTDPYAVQPAQTYPATSYGVGAAPPASTAGVCGLSDD